MRVSERLCLTAGALFCDVAIAGTDIHSDRGGELRVIIMGIDPGLGTTGWAIIEGTGERPSLLAYGAIRTKPSQEMADRLLHICRNVGDVLRVHSPDEVVIEDVFLARDTKAALALGQARGAAMLGAALQSVPVRTYTALQVKQSVTGNGHASKEQVAFMVRQLFRLTSAPEPADCADATAIALCHLHRCGDTVSVA